MNIKKIFDSIFVLSKSERNGAIVLFSIVLLLIISRFIIPAITQNNKKFEVDLDQRIVQLERIKDSLQRMKNETQSPISKAIIKEFKKENKSEAYDNVKYIQPIKFLFDPNLVTFEELIQLGFPERAARNLMSYRDKGGVFYYNEDLRKIYGIDSILFANVQPYILFADKKADKIQIELNSADSVALTSLKGIGPIYAARICKYRNYLRGFVSIEQLKEVYQFPEETYMAVKELLTLDETLVEKININFADVKELNKHPYCSYGDARKIVDYRSKKGDIQSVEQLLDDSIIDASVFKRFKPYLKVE